MILFNFSFQEIKLTIKFSFQTFRGKLFIKTGTKKHNIAL